MRAVISGYYGFGNAGDEAVLSGMLHALAPHGVQPIVISADPQGTEALHGAPAIGRGEWGRVVRAIRRADLFISGGGGLIQDRTSRRSSLYYLGLIGLAQGLGVTTYAYGQGVGPVNTATVRRAARLVLPRLAEAGVRDQASAEALVGLGVPAERVRVTADAAFALPPVQAAESEQALRRCGIDREGPLIGLIWRPPLRADAHTGAASDFGLAGAVARAARRFADQIEADVIVLPMHRAYDLAECRIIAEQVAGGGRRVTLVERVLDFRAIRALVSRCDLVCSVRYHGLLFAGTAGVPCVGLSYDPKVAALARDLGFGAIPVSSDEAEVVAAMSQAWSTRKEGRATMMERADTLRRRAEGEGAACVALVRRKRS